MSDTAGRLARLRELANKTTTPNYGREHIERLLEQETSSPDITCPRFAGVCEHAGDRLIIVGNDPHALVRELHNLALDDPPHEPQMIVDLDSDTCHQAHRTLHLRFRPELPGLIEGTIVELPPGSRSALKLILEVAEANNDEGNAELTEAIEIGDLILERIRQTLHEGAGQHPGPPAV